MSAQVVNSFYVAAGHILWWCRVLEAAVDEAGASQGVAQSDIDVHAVVSDEDDFASAKSSPQVSDDESCNEAQPDAAATGNPADSRLEDADLMAQQELTEVVNQLLATDNGWGFDAADRDDVPVAPAADDALADWDLNEWPEAPRCTCAVSLCTKQRPLNTALALPRTVDCSAAREMTSAFLDCCHLMSAVQGCRS